MTGLMISNDLLLFFAENTVLFLLTGDHDLNRLKQICLADRLSSCLYCHDRCLIDHIGKIGTNGTACRKCDLIEINRIIHQHILGMNLQDIHTTFEIRLLDDDTAVKTSRTKKCFIKHLRTVGCTEDHKSLGAVKAIHLGEKLVQCLLTLIIAAAILAVTALTDRIDLVNKDNTRSHRLCLLEQITHTGSAHTDKHLHKIRSGKGEKRHTRLAGNCLGKQCLTGSRGSYEQCSLRESGTNLRVLTRIIEEVDHLCQRVHRFLLTGNVLKRHTGLLLYIHLRRALANPHHATGIT